MSVEKFIKAANTHNFTPRMDRSVLLLIDLQEYFRDLLQPILPRLLTLCTAARDAGLPLFFTRHDHNSGDMGGSLGEWWAGLIREKSPESCLLSELKPRPKEPVSAKSRYSAFFKTDLETRLRRQGIEDVIIGGVMTNLCCETTARDAFIRDFRVFFLADGTAAAADIYHRASLTNLAYGFATLMTCEKLFELLET